MSDNPDHSQNEQPSASTPRRSKTIEKSSSAPGGLESSVQESHGDQKERRASFVLQGKGGVGKSLCAWVLAQHCIERHGGVSCFDTDPINQTLSGYVGLGAQKVELLRKDTINVQAVDELIDKLVATDKPSVIDNGAASFLPMSRYLVENSISSILADHGRRMVVHTVVSGGPETLDTVRGFAAIVQQYPDDVDVVVWINERHGVPEDEGTHFEDMLIYREHADRVLGIVRIPELDPNTHGADLADVLRRKLTFDEAVASPDFRIVAKSRLRQIRKTLFDQLMEIGL